MKFTKALIAGAATAMLAVAPVAAQVASAPVAAQDEENAFGRSGGSLAAIFAVLVFGAFLIFHGEDDDQPVSP